MGLVGGPQKAQGDPSGEKGGVTPGLGGNSLFYRVGENTVCFWGSVVVVVVELDDCLVFSRGLTGGMNCVCVCVCVCV